MQKKLIALAVAAAFSAPAFADVTMYGNVDAAVAHASADGQKSDTIAVSGGLSASRLGVKGAEDLSNGMKAVVVLEYGLDPQTNSTIGASGVGNSSVVARQQMLALAGDFGTVATGYLQTTAYDWAVKFDPMADSLVSPLQNVTAGSTFLIGSATGAARAQRALAYISPNMSGVTVAVNYSTALAGVGNLTAPSTAAVDPKTSAFLLSANYDNGPLSVGAVYTGATAGTTYLPALATETSTLSATDIALGASYDFTVVKLFATYQTSKTGTNNIVTTAGTNKAMSVSAVAPVGPGAIALSYAKNTIDASSTLSSLSKVGTGTDMGASGVTLAWLQGLSKTTTFYAAYTKTSQGANTASYSVINDALAASTAAGWASGGGSSSMLAVGLNKKF
ncbi:outer membrane porin protein 32 precursor [mine drainage metagenome]|uniref:Outer membrane porin protein 32 n=1 Tax=mine drainage metagenome TaxID=410659 RepID=A0A1J5RB65_9ZZZZ